MSKAISRQVHPPLVPHPTAVVGSALAVDPIDYLLQAGHGLRLRVRHLRRRLDGLLLHDQRRPQLAARRAASWPAGGRPTTPPTAAAPPATSSTATPPAPPSARAAARAPAATGGAPAATSSATASATRRSACYGPVVCRVATCTPPWRYDPSCTTSSATDNRTVNHGAPCLPRATDAPRHADRQEVLRARRRRRDPRPVRPVRALGRRRWRALGEVPQRQHLLELGDRRTRGARRGAGGVRPHRQVSTRRSSIRLSDIKSSANGRAKYNNFQGGRIYYLYVDGARRACSLPTPFLFKHEQLGGIYGVLGVPASSALTSADHRSRYVNFDLGRIYHRGSTVLEIHGAVFTKHEATGGVHGAARLPDHRPADLQRRQGRSGSRAGASPTPVATASESHGPIGPAIWRTASSAARSASRGRTCDRSVTATGPTRCSRVVRSTPRPTSAGTRCTARCSMPTSATAGPGDSSATRRTRDRRPGPTTRPRDSSGGPRL